MSDLNEVKADVVTPAPDAGFIQDPERETKRADLPFQKVWVESGVDFKHYRELIVAPVNTQHMLKMDWLHKMTRPNGSAVSTPTSKSWPGIFMTRW